MFFQPAVTDFIGQAQRMTKNHSVCITALWSPS
jgi:hypothetical protein